MIEELERRVCLKQLQAHRDAGFPAPVHLLAEADRLGIILEGEDDNE